MLDFRMETFLALCRTMNYTRAAEELNITQPAVTQHIQYLQRHYGVKPVSYTHLDVYKRQVCVVLGPG